MFRYTFLPKPYFVAIFFILSDINISKMRRFISFVLMLIFFMSSLYSQNYFQQEVNYKINVRLDDSNHMIYADEIIEYTNNSPDTLTFLYFHLWPNGYKNNNTALAKQQINMMNKKLYSSSSEDKGYIDGLDFKINGDSVHWEYDKNNIDICKIYLNEPLLSGEKIKIATPFYVKIPSGKISRLGHYKESYQLSQWYPKPAVYDSKGWHHMPYLDMGEFYSEYGNYDVSITLPENYIVGATGNLETKSEIAILDSLAKKTDEMQSFTKDIEFPKSSEKVKTIRYTEKKIHDFAWFADKRFNVLKGNVVLPHSKDTVTTWAFFTNYQARLWKNALEYINDAVYYYSLWIGDYPYKNCSAVEGALSAGGGMEYPTITIIGFTSDAHSLEQVIMHEVGHNWFYGILGSNERDYPWMDEGINSFYELRYLENKYPNRMLYQSVGGKLSQFLDIYQYPQRKMYEIGYQFNARRNLDQECTLASEEFYAMNYGVITYWKNAFVFNYLKHYLGNEEFDRIMKIYFEKWKFKHPMPDDFIQLFKDNAKEDLNWFFDDLLQTRKRVDYKISSLRQNELTVKNIGQIVSPFRVSLLNNDSIVYSFWNKAISKKDCINLPNVNFTKAVIDLEEAMPDVNKKNNYIYSTGLFKKRKQIGLKFLGSAENPEKSKIYFAPIIGFNYYDKIMPGFLFYNSVFPTKKIEYFIMPLFSSGNTTLSGEAKINYNIFPVKTPFQYIAISLAGAKYSIYENSFHKLKFEIDAKFKNQSINKSIENRIVIRNYYLTNLENLLFDSVSYSFYHNVHYTYSNFRKFNPFEINLNIDAGKGFVKSSFEGKYKFTYENYKKGFEIRVFAGKFLYNSETYYGNYNFRLSGNTGWQDYTYDNPFLGRMENISTTNGEHILSQQFMKNDGGFTTYTYVGQTNNWIATIGVKTNIPGKLPIKLYANAGTFAGAGSSTSSQIVAFETGIELYIIPDIFAVYFPVSMSKDIRQENAPITKTYIEKVRFTLNINKLNPFKYAKDFIL
ncbi:MAG TPA: hypothetical protein DDX39_04485 [Bacteroidales bacterium]|nr:MAG: hypothetical protein A2W98_10515 [Bacteroidetes bacterium GWF2_33_38]OFY87094.1 MAG: hypothetical protein A2236_02815 [Bacteroidetes bacterium RIFOXYA2_FULL_33_7]HBF87881.1 hypothetical protein [Bacteroidales bacterium]